MVVRTPHSPIMPCCFVWCKQPHLIHDFIQFLSRSIPAIVKSYYKPIVILCLWREQTFEYDWLLHFAHRISESAVERTDEAARDVHELQATLVEALVINIRKDK